MPNATNTDSALSHVLNTWRLSGPQTLTGGYQNKHWLVTATGGTKLVLRRYKENHASDLPYEFEVMRLLANRGLPVPRLVEEPMEHEGITWFLMTRMPGAESTIPLADEQRRRGRLLAEFHESSIELSAINQRQGFQLPEDWVNDEALVQQLQRYEAVQPEEGYALRWHLDLTRELLAAHDLSSTEKLILHGDFVGRNLLFEGERLTGILDLESTHLSYRVTDFASAWRGCYDEVVHGYEEVHPLSELDQQLIVPSFWGLMFSGLKKEISAMDDAALSREDYAWHLKLLSRRSPLFGDLQNRKPRPIT